MHQCLRGERELVGSASIGDRECVFASTWKVLVHGEVVQCQLSTKDVANDFSREITFLVRREKH